jgi:succinoglycan biosynthesis protein ExoA
MTRQARREEAHDLGGLHVERAGADVCEAGAHELETTSRVGEGEEGPDGGIGVAGRHDDAARPVAERLGDPPDVCGDDGKAGGAGLEENLRQPLRQRHVQEGIGAPVSLSQLGAEGNPARDLERSVQPKLARLLLERTAEGPVTDDLESPVAGLAEPCQDLGQQQRVLLLLETSDAEQPNGLPPARPRFLGGVDLMVADEREAAHERVPASVAAGEITADDNGRSMLRQAQEGSVEEVRGGKLPGLRGPGRTMVDVTRKVRAYAEKHRHASAVGSSHEVAGEWVWTEDPHRIELADQRGERALRSDACAKDASDVGQALVMGKRHERQPRGREHVRGGAGARIETSEQDELVHELGQPGEKVHEGDVAGEDTVLSPVAVAAEDTEPHLRKVLPVSARTPTVSVVVPALNEAAHIERCLRSIMAQRPQAPLEVIVVDGGSTDGTPALARKAGAIVLENRARIIPEALNRALPAVRGEVFLRFDAHSQMGPGYLTACLRALAEEPQAVNVGGWCEIEATGPWGRALAAALRSRFGVGNARLWRPPSDPAVRKNVESVPFGCFRVAALRTAGGWESSLPVNEDYELNARLRSTGGKVLFDPSIRAIYHPRESLRQIAVQHWRYGRWKAVMLKRSPRELRLRQLAPPGLLVVLALACLPGRLASPARLGLGSYLCGIGTVALRSSAGWRTAAVLASMHLSWGGGFVRGLASRDAGARRRTEGTAGSP